MISSTASQFTRSRRRLLVFLIAIALVALVAIISGTSAHATSIARSQSGNHPK